MSGRSLGFRLQFVVCLIVFIDAGMAFSQVTWVRDGKVCAVVVTGDNPSPVATYAVAELVDHVEKATSIRLPVASESNIPKGYESRIFVGATVAAKKLGIAPEKLDIEEYVLRTDGRDLYIVGKELHSDQYHGSRPLYSEPWNPLSAECMHSGTLFGVYELLDRYVGVRWLWPGELGTYVPRRTTLEVPEINEVLKSTQLYRDLGDWSSVQSDLTGSRYGKQVPRSYQSANLTEELVRKLVFPSDEAAYEYGKSMDVFRRRHRQATPIEHPRVILGAHTIGSVHDMWAKYGQEHPEWFAMRADGNRGLTTPRAGPFTPLCVSNTQLQICIVNEAWNGVDPLTLGEADGARESMCQCPRCLAADGPQQRDYPPILRNLKYIPRAMGDRYAKYWRNIYDLAAKRNPDVKISVYLYHNTLPAPVENIKLNKNIFGEFVIYGSWDGWFPMSEAEDQWYRDQWLRWANTGMSLVYGPNYLLNNYTTPNITTWQSGKLMNYAATHGMVGINFRSTTFSWAVHGPMAYMHHRLLWNPKSDIGKIRQEYFSAFGPAAADIEKYFDYWESYARTRPSIVDASQEVAYDTHAPVGQLRRIRGHYLAYPPEVYTPAKAMLAQALEAVKKDPLPEFAHRIEFLQAGLEHAILSTRIHQFINYDSPEAGIGSAPTDPTKLQQARSAMRELMEFRHKHENLFVSDYISNAMYEQSFIRNIETLIGGKGTSKEYVPDDDIF